MLKKFLAALLALAMVINIIPAANLTVQAAEGDYEIYPTPHSVAYKDGSFEIGNDVNVVFEDGLDQVTEDKLINVLQDHEISPNPTRTMAEGKTNVLVGIKGSEGYVDAYASEHVSYESETFAENHYDAYVLDISNGVITILGDSTDGAFYGIVTLMHILNQANGTIRNLIVHDYADVAIRGFIEGYYGLPWSNEDRMSLMKFGGQLKMTCYIYAPKDEPYHTSKWRELYPEAEINAIKEMVAVGNANKCRFVWTAHPFMNNGFNKSDVDGEISKLLGKYEQLYGVGVRQFGVLGDDVGSLDRAIVIRVMKAVSEWAEAKGDVYDTVFCPAGYNHSWQNGVVGNYYAELKDYDAEFPEDIQIFWTGQAVCQPITTETLENFRTFELEEGAAERRAPLFWLNWPVNDINSARMLLGKGSLLHTDVDPEDLAGVVTNPMQEAESSKVAIFAVADYAWNIAGFNDEQSWTDSFKYVDAEAAEELHTLAKHMSDPSPNGHGLVLEESAELGPKLEEYISKLASGTLTGQDHTDLLEEFQTIADACDGFHEKSKNENLKDELKPFTDSLKEKCLAVVEFIKTQQAVEAGNEEDAWSHYSQAIAYLANSKTHLKPALIDNQVSESYVAPSAKRITPFVENLSKALSPVVSGMIDDSKLVATYITNRTDAPATGSVDNIMDGDVSTNAVYKTPNEIKQGDYVGVRFAKSIAVEKIRFVLGAGKNHFDQGKLQYTEDGTTWRDLELTGMTNLFNGVLNEVQDVSIEKNNLPADFKAMGIRFIATRDNAQDAWLEVSEILINASEKEESKDYYTGTIFVPSDFSIHQGTAADVTDGNDNTFIWYATPGNTVTAGQYVGIDLGETKEIGAIHFAMPSGDCLSNYTLQYSADGETYTDLQTFTSLTADLDLNEQNITARYIRAYNNENTGRWLKVASFSVYKPVSLEQEIFTNKTVEVTGYSCVIVDDTATMTGTGEVTLAPGEFVGIQLERIKDITDISVTGTGEGFASLTLQTSKNNVIWTDVTQNTRAAYEDARYIRMINKTEDNVTATVSNITVKSKEFEPISVESTNFGQKDTHLNAFDNDRTTEAVLEASQNAGMYIIYDLGQEITLDSLKLVLHDGTTDYPRHAKVSVSTDQQQWESVMTIGNQDSANPGEAENTDNISDLFPVHEISYNTLEKTGISKTARYLKFEITRTKAGGDKWVRIREIELNGGNFFMPESNDPTILTTGQESSGNVASNIIDGDLSTTFQPVGNKAGSFTYSLSENTEVKRINIMQSPNTVSGADVTAEVVKNGTVKTVTLGKLTESFNKFNTSAYDHVLSVTVTWKKGSPCCIQEIILLNNLDAGLDKTELYDAYNSAAALDKTEYSPATYEKLEQALAQANRVLNDGNATAEMISAAKAALETAVNGLVTSEAHNSLMELLQKKLNGSDYTAESWYWYQMAIDNVNTALREGGNNYSELLASLWQYYDGLVTILEDSIAKLQDTVTSAEEKDQEDYTPLTWTAFREQLMSALNLLNKESKTVDKVNKMNTALKTKMDALKERATNKAALEALIAEKPSAAKKTEYTAASWAEYETALNAAKQILENPEATTAEVTAAIDHLTERADALVQATNESRLKEFYAEMAALNLNSEDYTTDSWAEYERVMSEVKVVVENASSNEADCEAALNSLRNAYDNLVTTLQGSIRQLNAKIAEAEEKTEANYTPNSWAAFKEALEDAKYVERYVRLKSKTEIDTAIEALNEKAGALTERANLTELTNQINGVPSEDQKENYTKVSWDAMKEKLNAANRVKADLNATQEQVDNAKTELQQAVGALLVRGDKSGLTALVESVKGMNPSDYTESTWAAVKEKEAAAKLVLDADASVEAVYEAKTALENAVKGLKKVDKPSDNGTSSDTTNTNNSTTNTNSSAANNSSTTTNTNNSTANTSSTANAAGAGTGDSTQIMLWILLLAASAVVPVMKRRKIKADL